MPPLRLPAPRRLAPLALAVAIACGAALPAAAKSPSGAELAALKAELDAMRARIAALESQLAAASAQPAPASAAPAGAQAAVTASGEPADASPSVEPGPGFAAATADDAAAFELGGRIHFDTYAQNPDSVPSTGGTEFRRARFDISGTAAGWDYILQAELSGRNSDLRDVYLSRAFGDTTLYIGQFKPFRSLDELISSNDFVVLERGFGSGSTLFNDAQWQQGVGVLQELGGGMGTLGISAFSLREDNTPRNEGWGTAARGTWLPIGDGATLVHLGASYSLENGGKDTPARAFEAAYGGRRGPEALLFESAAGRDFEQRSLGLEFAGRMGGFHWQSEWQRATVAGLAGDGRLETQYLQVGYLFGGMRAYDTAEGIFDSPEDAAGLWELVARMDRIKLRHVANVEALRWVLGVNWYATDDVRFLLNWTQGEDQATGDEPSQLALRAQYVF